MTRRQGISLRRSSRPGGWASRLVERLADQDDNFEALVELVQDCLPEHQA